MTPSAIELAMTNLNAVYRAGMDRQGSLNDQPKKSDAKGPVSTNKTDRIPSPVEKPSRNR